VTNNTSSTTAKKYWKIGVCIILAVGIIACVWFLSHLHDQRRLADLLYLQHQQRDAILHGETPAVRVAAIRDMRSDPDVGILIQALNDEDVDVRIVAAHHLQGPKASKAARALIEALKDRHISVRKEAAFALASMGTEIVPALVEALADPNPRVRAGTLLALLEMIHPMLGWIWSPDEVATIVPAIRPLLHDEDPEVRLLAKLILQRRP
jgi:hypothetical protein